ncbi:MAG: universal stress protein [Roseobacter sp.]
MFRCIVVGVDGSEPSNRALTAACALSRTFGSEVHLVHGFETASDSKASMVLEAAKTQAKTDGVSPSSSSAVDGEPYQELMTIAGLYNSDLIVTGRRGLGCIEGLISGSTSQQIAKHARCAVLTVK